MIKINVQLLLIVVLMIGCKNPCRNNNVNPAFVGFSQNDIDTIILKSFKPNDNFRQPVDTILIANFIGGASIYTTINDTTFVYINNSNPNHNISSGLDWQIYIPAQNKTISISNILSESNEGGKGCLNPIKSFIQNGLFIVPQIYNTKQFYTSGYHAYIYN